MDQDTLITYRVFFSAVFKVHEQKINSVQLMIDAVDRIALYYNTLHC